VARRRAADFTIDGEEGVLRTMPMAATLRVSRCPPSHQRLIAAQRFALNEDPRAGAFCRRPEGAADAAVVAAVSC